MLLRLSSHTCTQNGEISLFVIVTYTSRVGCDIFLLRTVEWRRQCTIFFRCKCEILYENCAFLLHPIKFHCTFLISIKCRLNFFKVSTKLFVGLIIRTTHNLNYLPVRLPSRNFFAHLTHEVCDYCICLTQFFCIAWDLHKNEHQLEFYNI